MLNPKSKEVLWYPSNCSQINAERESAVDFTAPFLESGVAPEKFSSSFFLELYKIAPENILVNFFLEIAKLCITNTFASIHFLGNCETEPLMEICTSYPRK